MPDSRPPRIRVTLPGDTPGRITGWRQDKTGRWWAVVEVHAPADSVQQVPGEDYSSVPRTPHTPTEPATNPEPRYVLTADTRTTPPTAELHRADCWTIAKPAAWRRITPMPTAQDAADQLKIPDTAACDTCQPKP
jgi:hypothetical protein